MSKYVVSIKGKAFNSYHVDNGNTVPLCTGIKGKAENWASVNGELNKSLRICQRCIELTNPTPYETEMKIAAEIKKIHEDVRSKINACKNRS